ncbi:MAG: hypothetical protein ABSB90_03805 [Thermoplasmata archaeon]
MSVPRASRPWVAPTYVLPMMAFPLRLQPEHVILDRMTARAERGEDRATPPHRPGPWIDRIRGVHRPMGSDRTAK